ncbi:MAG: hypothetical protein IJC59_05185 [Lachnospiraceae bacterium]|nr:hypothetical protein [Lachnospiraceae bacterium]
MFSYEDYRRMIRLIKESGRYMGYRRAMESDAFIIMRHDVEYSVERAYALAKVEESMDFTSNFFFQWTNNSYNVLSRKNVNMIRDMRERGHKIGLHFALNGMTDMDQIRKSIRKEMEILSEMFGFEVKQFSVHRPSLDILRENIRMEGILNAYQDDFFTFAENISKDTPVAVKYLSDANHIWRYGYPDEETLSKHPKVQILIHPFAWTPEGYDNFENYQSLLAEKYREIIDSVDRECKDFCEYRRWFLKETPDWGKL